MLGRSWHAQDNLPNHGQPLVIRQSDQKRKNDLLDTRYSGYAGTRASKKLVKLLSVNTGLSKSRYSKEIFKQALADAQSTETVLAKKFPAPSGGKPTTFLNQKEEQT